MPPTVVPAKSYCWGHIGKQKVTVEGILEKSAYIEKFWNFGGVHCEFLNIGGRIENRPKLQGVNPYFPLEFINIFITDPLWNNFKDLNHELENHEIGEEDNFRMRLFIF